MKQLIICEKPKVAQKIANSLADGKPEHNRMKGINYYYVSRNGNDIYIVSAVGHVYSLEQSNDKEKGYPIYDIEWKPSYLANKSAAYTKAYVDTIKSLSKGIDEYINACDFDIEGSLIGWNAIRFACKAKKGKRMKYSALTGKDLVEAYENLIELDYSNANAGEARHMLDWFYGINLSRALMTSVRKFHVYQTLSIGRVQGPALAMLAKKEIKINEFVPEPYWELWTLAKKTKFMHENKKFTVKNDVEQALENSQGEAVITNVQATKKKQKPYPPFDLTSLQIEVFAQFKILPSQTLKIAQTLYETSMISYPRTSSQKLPAKLRLEKIIRTVSNQQMYTELCNKLIKENRFKPLEGVKDDPAHPAIHPTGIVGSVGVKEMKVYDLIVRRFLSCFAPFAEREHQKVTLTAGTEKYVTMGTITIVPGWFEYYGQYVRLKDTQLPKFKSGESVDVKPTIDEKETQAPKRYTHASIISELEKRKLGTKATRSSIVDTLFKRGYVDGKSIAVNKFGLEVYETLNKYCPDITDEKLTRNIEEKMEQIQANEITKDDVIEHGKQTLNTIIQIFKKNENEIGKLLADKLRSKQREEVIIGPCSKCGGELLLLYSPRTKNHFIGCRSYPKCNAIYPVPRQSKIVPENKICEKCNTPIINVIRKGKRPFSMCIDPKCETKANWGKWKKPDKKKTGTKKTTVKKTTVKKKTSTSTKKTTVKKTTTKKSTVKKSVTKK